MKNSQKIINNDIKEIVHVLGNDVKKLAGKTILITGSNGFLGSYLTDTVKYLNDFVLDKPCHVLGLNRSKITSEMRNYHLVEDKNFKFIQHDVVNTLKVAESIDFIFHVAGCSTPAVFQKYPLETIDVNVKGIRWLLDLSIEKKIKSIVYFSSGEIYGSPPSQFIPTPETYNGNISTLDSRACYTESKRLAETLCKIYFDEFNVPVKIVRPFVIYGPGITINDGKVLSDFMRYGIMGEPIQMLTEGLDIRSDCYVSDATIGFWKILFSNYNGEVFNVGNERQEFTIRQLAEIIHKVCKIFWPPIYKGESVPDYLRSAPKRFCPDMTKFKNLFKFEPKIDIEEGARRTIEWNKLKFGL